jgi:NAD(P)H-dependent FMN reductase
MLIKVILGSTREARAGEKVARWVMRHAEKYTGNLEFEFIDLKEIGLPFMDEPVSPMASSDYKHEHTKAWSRIISEADGFIFVTPEYNRGYSGVLKNALDFLYVEWQDKPAAFVGYGGSGARSSISQLRHVMEFMKFRLLDYQVGIGKIWEAFDEAGEVKADHVRGELEELFKLLEASFK